MNAISIYCQRDVGKVIDDQPGSVRLADGLGLNGQIEHFVFGPILDAQLHPVAASRDGFLKQL